jgi:hypothetical protein
VQKWEFGQNRDQRWFWRRMHDVGTFLQSADTFDTRMQCIANAFDHGYLSPATEQSIFFASSDPH